MGDGAPGDTPASPSPGRARRYVAGLAAAIVPGLGHMLYGRFRLAALFLLPTAVAVGAGAAVVASTDRTGLAARLVDPEVLGALIVVQAAVLAWRLLALGSTLLVARPPRYRALDILPVAVLTALVVLPQGYGLALTSVAREAAVEVFGGADSGAVWRPSPSSLSSGGAPAPGRTAAPGTTAAPGPTDSPAPTLPLGERRLTVLLIGEDSGVGRQTALTDTMIVASLDPIGRTVSLLSIPRDLVDAPIPGGGTWRPKINSLSAWVRLHPDAFPGSGGNGQAVLAGVIGELIGVPIDYWAQVNLAGLIRVVDTVGGVDVSVSHAFCDPGYDEYGQQGFGIPVGRWHLDGSQALAYARVRKAAGESDFTRAARQQEVLAGLRDAVVRGGFLGDPIGFLQAIGQAVRTNVPPSILPDVAGLAGEIGRDRLFRAVVQDPLVRSGMDVRGSIQIPDVPGIRALAARLFPAPGVLPVVGTAGTDGGGSAGAGVANAGPSGTPGPSGTTGATAAPSPAPTEAVPAGRAPNAPRIVCHAAPAPAPTPRPTARPTPLPTASASPAPTSSDVPGSPEPTAATAEPGAPTPGPTAEPTASPVAPATP